MINFLKHTLKLFSILAIIFLIIFTAKYFLNVVESKKIKKDLSDKYYYTEKEYGWAGSLITRNLEFFEVRKLWFDRKIGKIIWESSVNPVTVKMLEEKNNLINIKIM